MGYSIILSSLFTLYYKPFRNLSGPPKIDLPPELKNNKPVTVNKGEDLVLKVPYTGRPKPKVC